MTNNRKQQEIVYFSFLFSNLSKTRVWVFNKYCELPPKVRHKTFGVQFKAASIVNEAYFIEQ